MDKSALKKVIKPIIKECLKEVLVEEGLVKVIKEFQVRENNQAVNEVYEQKPLIKKLHQESKVKKQTISEDLKKSFTGFNPFAGTEDIDTMEAKAQEKLKQGVNIESMFGADTVNSWNQQLEMFQGKK